MLLERVEIVGFRGINRLSLMLEQNNVLIGENAWGKSSLLDALTLLLSPESDLYHFVRDDFWFPPGDVLGREHHLHIILTFCEYRPDICHHSERLSRLSPVWCRYKDGFHRIRYRAAAELSAAGLVLSEHLFLGAQGQRLTLDEPQAMIHLLMLMNPVLRLRDSRSTRYGGDDFNVQWEAQLAQVSDEVAVHAVDGHGHQVVGRQVG